MIHKIYSPMLASLLPTYCTWNKNKLIDAFVFEIIGWYGN